MHEKWKCADCNHVHTNKRASTFFCRTSPLHYYNHHKFAMAQCLPNIILHFCHDVDPLLSPFHYIFLGYYLVLINQVSNKLRISRTRMSQVLWSGANVNLLGVVHSESHTKAVEIQLPTRPSNLVASIRGCAIFTSSNLELLIHI